MRPWQVLPDLFCGSKRQLVSQQPFLNYGVRIKVFFFFLNLQLSLYASIHGCKIHLPVPEQGTQPCVQVSEPNQLPFQFVLFADQLEAFGESA